MKAAHTSSKYVLFLDDDIRLHPDTVDVLVDAMEADPEVNRPQYVRLCKLQHRLGVPVPTGKKNPSPNICPCRHHAALPMCIREYAARMTDITL